jgi:Zinc-binding dehydrogenase/Alcohol dehydrogenase GroES-like domain
MRQIWISKAGPPETLVVKEAPDPDPRAGEARIRVEASGVNFADVMGRMGLYPDLPRIPVVPGYEVAGRVDSVGEGVDPGWIGRNVFALTRFGGYADVVCAPTSRIFARPEGMSAEEGAAIPVNYLTAWQLIVVMGGLKAGETMLVHSAGGGVGVAATQIAKQIGAKVIGTASAAKHQQLRALGVDHLIDSHRGLRKARARDHPRAGCRTHPRRGRRRVAQEGLSASRAHGPAWNFRRFVGRQEQDRGNAGHDVDARRHALASIQSALLDEREQGRLRRQPGAYVGRSRSHGRLDERAHAALGARRHQASDRADVQLCRGPGRAPFHSRPQQPGKSVAYPVESGHRLVGAARGGGRGRRL